ncbi:MAG: toxin-activating lysine-acyltransferase [Rhodospirillales bacterium]
MRFPALADVIDGGEMSKTGGDNLTAAEATGVIEQGSAPPTVGAAGGSAEVTAPKAGIDKITALGNAVWLMTQSQLHRNLLVSDMEWMLVPPCAFGQFRLWRHDNGLPIAFATYAMASPEIVARFKSTPMARLKPEEWQSGQIPLLVDAIFPWGGLEEGLAELRQVLGPALEIFAVKPVGKTEATNGTGETS